MLVTCTASPDLADGKVQSPYAGELSSYTVNDRDAGLFDVSVRAEALRRTRNTMIRELVRRWSTAASCRAAEGLPVIEGNVKLPLFYVDRDGWRQAIKPYQAFENAVTGLAAAFVATRDSRYAECLVNVLASWADADAFMRFRYTKEGRQTWYAIESSLIAASLSYAVVRGHVPGRSEGGAEAGRLAVVDGWFNRAARHHIGSFAGGYSSCCNNHFYRRALYATVVGILTRDDELFQYGISAPYMALSEMNPDGSLPREVSRKARAIHYQNFALLYLVPIMELAERQGYPLYQLKIKGRTIHDGVSFVLDAIADQGLAARYTSEPQDLWFLQDDQYYAWMEIYLSRFDSPRIQAVVAPVRPIFNRSAIGPATMYFLELED